MPDGHTTSRGVVTFVSRVASGGDQAGSGQAGGGQPGGGGSGGAAPTVQVTVALADQRGAGRLDQAPVQVSITDQLHHGVLAVPVTALLGTAEGGYAVTPAAGGPDLRVSVG